MAHTILEKREVPFSETNTLLFSGRPVTENMIHGGEKSVCVRVDNGYMAWGFGATWEMAEHDAVNNAWASA